MQRRSKKYVLLAAALSVGSLTLVASFAPQASAQIRPQGRAQGPFNFSTIPKSVGLSVSDFRVRNMLPAPTGTSYWGIVYSYGANGTQDYVCRANATGAAWAFTGPRANLIQEYVPGRVGGVHYNLQGTPLAGGPQDGPRWEFGGNVIRGRLVASVPAVNPTRDIPSLLLSAEAEYGDRYGASFLTREELSGGVTPTTGCTTATIGAVAQVPYSAVYNFWGSFY